MYVFNLCRDKKYCYCVSILGLQSNILIFFKSLNKLFVIKHKTIGEKQQNLWN